MGKPSPWIIFVFRVIVKAKQVLCEVFCLAYEYVFQIKQLFYEFPAVSESRPRTDIRDRLKFFINAEAQHIGKQNTLLNQNSLANVFSIKDYHNFALNVVRLPRAKNAVLHKPVSLSRSSFAGRDALCVLQALKSFACLGNTATACLSLRFHLCETSN